MKLNLNLLCIDSFLLVACSRDIGLILCVIVHSIELLLGDYSVIPFTLLQFIPPAQPPREFYQEWVVEEGTLIV